jgi:hypothetical protein
MMAVVRHSDGLPVDMMLVWAWKFGITSLTQMPRSSSAAWAESRMHIDHHAHTAAPGKESQHHLAEDTAAEISPRIDDNDIAGLVRVEHVPVQLAPGLVIFGLAIEALALGHALQSQRRAGDGTPLFQRPRPRLRSPHEEGVSWP